VFTKSRGGFLGLLAMGAVLGYYVARIKPGIIFAAVFAVMLAMPLMPASFWARMDSIGNAESDPSGSRAARIRLLNQGLQVFVDNPITGIGAGQFMNYDGPGMVERWRVTHNVWLQVAAELGIFGLAAFAFLVYRGFSASLAAMRALRPQRRKSARAGAARRATTVRAGPEGNRATGRRGDQLAPLTTEERHILDINAKGMLAALTGWFVCAFFASVAFNWTFYYVLALAVAGREIATSRQPATEESNQTSAPRLVAARG
jgi:O-antigen ligase